MNWVKRTILNWRWWVCLPVTLTILVLALIAKSIALIFEFLGLLNEAVQAVYSKIDHRGSLFVRRMTLWGINGK